MRFAITSAGKNPTSWQIFRWPPGHAVEAVIRARGTFGGASIAMQTRLYGASEIDTHADATFTQADVLKISLEQGIEIRFQRTGGTDVDVTIDVN